MINTSIEAVDIVDEGDGILYQASKKEAHEKGLLHRTVISEIKDKQGKWILVKQAADRQDAGQYVSPIGGHVQAGETEDDALLRETKEESGLTNFDYKLIGKAVFNRYIKNRQENHYFILYEIYTEEKHLQLNHESEDFKVFTTEELKQFLKQTPQVFGEAFHFIVKIFYSELLE